ncbi:MAG TPA: hypothetical protein VN675_02510 [Burkholderiales bacterium]|nr:hypothetical protein [Burkholderiales bacterium]
MILRTLFALAGSLALAGCGSMLVAEMSKKPNVVPGAVSVTDLRTEEQRQPKRASNFSAINFLGEEEVSPSALLFLQDALARYSSQQPLALTVREFRIVDFFPKRLNVSGLGLAHDLILAGLVDAKTDWSFVKDLGIPTNADSVICVLSGSLNGAEIKVAAYRSYDGPAAGLIRKSSPFQDAVLQSIDNAAVQALRGAGVPVKQF